MNELNKLLDGVVDIVADVSGNTELLTFVLGILVSLVIIRLVFSFRWIQYLGLFAFAFLAFSYYQKGEFGSLPGREEPFFFRE